VAAVSHSAPIAPSDGELGLASWEPGDLAGLVQPAWDDFLGLAAELDLDGPTRLTGWTARDILVHLGSWPGSRSFLQMREEAERDDAAVDWAEHRASTFDQDAHDNRAALERNGKLTIPVLAVGGEISTSGPLVEEMMREVAEDVTGVIVPRTAHWIPEENPDALVRALIEHAGPG